MEALKHSIIEASEAVEEEKRKNVELLRMIFPANIAQKLWRGRCSECNPNDVMCPLGSVEDMCGACLSAELLFCTPIS